MGKAITLANWKGPGATGYVPKEILKQITELYANGGAAAKLAAKNKPAAETDDQIDARLQGKFETLATMTAAAINGDIHSFIVSGPPGMSKSYITDKMFLEAVEHNKARKCVDVHGYVRPTGLYKMLYENGTPKHTIKFDDSDSIFKDAVSLNILKAALDMKARRRISWLAETNMKDEGGDKVPRHFDFEGNVIFVTNIDFAAAADGDSELSEHLQALMSRSHYLDLGIHTVRDRLIRVKRVVTIENMLQKDGFTAAEEKEIYDYVVENQKQLREVSLRMVAKLANLARANKQWKTLAKATCMNERAVVL